MLHANKAHYGASLRRELVSNQKMELDWYYANFSDVAVKAVYLAGFAWSCYESGDDDGLEHGTDSTTGAILLFYVLATAAFTVALLCATRATRARSGRG